MIRQIRMDGKWVEYGCKYNGWSMGGIMIIWVDYGLNMGATWVILVGYGWNGVDGMISIIKN